MSKNYMNDSQASEIIKYISDTMKFPIMGAGGGFAPIGTINFFDASVAPQGWLACDGSVVNIADYPDLATYYASVHGSSNFYGGDGTTTFAVPDLRGEFLRGSGTNSHANQGNGGAVGEHQDSTTILNGYMDMPNNEAWLGFTGSGEVVGNKDSQILTGTDWNYVKGTRNSETNRYKSTIRPTNTSFLICVKATLSDAEINAFNVYTPREHQVAWWEEEIDGVWKRKPVYERVFTGTTGATSVWTVIADIGSTCIFIGGEGGIVFSSNMLLQGGYSMGANVDILYNRGNNEAENGKIAICHNYESFVDVPVRIIGRYIKTTDQWQTS